MIRKETDLNLENLPELLTGPVYIVFDNRTEEMRVIKWVIRDQQGTPIVLVSDTGVVFNWSKIQYISQRQRRRTPYG